MGYDVNDIIGEYDIKLDFDVDLVVEEAFKYDKINETIFDVEKESLKKLIGVN